MTPSFNRIGWGTGYNPQEGVLYLAVEVQDESTLIDTTSAADWSTQDGCDVYLDVTHKEGNPSAAQYVVWSNTRRVYGGGASADVEVKVQRIGKAQSYEYRIEVGRISKEQVSLHPGMTLGVDVAVGDKDRDGSFSWMAWGKGIGKVNIPEHIGDVVLVESETRTGELHGRMQWEGREENVARAKVKVQSSISETLWVQATTDTQGIYALELPAGTYRVGVAGREWQSGQGVVAEVKAGSELAVDLVKAIPRGKTAVAGKGRSGRAGAGNRQGVWMTLDASDGLPTPFINALYQDRAGQLWFGTTEGGVSRYDGVRFTTFTAEDGLAGNSVGSILEDQDGQLWFGTEGGVSQYDGVVFQNLRRQLSLPLQSRDGRSGGTAGRRLPSRGAAGYCLG